jgi:hypothetical protein
MSDQVRRSMSYPLMCCSCRAMPRTPIRHTEFGIRNLEIRNPRSPEHGAASSGEWSGRSDLFHPHTFPLDD